MAYKFQLGNARLGGQVSANGLDAQDANVTNVGDVAVDSLSADGSLITLDDHMQTATNKELQFRSGVNKILSPAAMELVVEASASLKLQVDGNAIIEMDEFGIVAKQDLQMSGSAKLAYPDSASGKILIGDGNGYAPQAVSGDATLASNGALTIANTAVESGMLNNNVISGQTALGGASAAQADELLFSDAGTLKKITFSNLEDSIFGNVSGDIGIAAGGAATISANAVEGSMLNNNAISGRTALGATADQGDELLISDGGTLKKITVSNLEDTVFGNISGDATVAAGGAMTLAGAQTNVTSLKHASLVVGAASGNDHISFATAGSILLQTNNVSRITVTDTTTTIAGNLVVQGTTTTVDSTAINITGSFVFEGSSPDANETTLNVIDPTADRTISLADSAGTLVPFAATPAAGVTISATPAELNLLDGSEVHKFYHF